MSKYLLKAVYGAEGVKGLSEMGGSPRRENATKTIEGLGGSVESFYYQLDDGGVVNVLVVCDLPDAQAATSLWLHINGSGRVLGNVTPLVTVEDIDAVAAAKKEQ